MQLGEGGESDRICRDCRYVMDSVNGPHVELCAKHVGLSKVAKDLYEAAHELYMNCSDLGETTIDPGHDEYDPESPDKEYRDWAELDAALEAFEESGWD